MKLTPGKTRWIGLKGLLALAAATLVISAAWRPAAPARFVAPPPSAPHLRLTGTSRSLPVTTPSVHAASLVALPSGRLLAAWFGGSREGAANVAIFLSRFDGRQWSAAEKIMTPAQMTRATGHYTRKLGNPVLHLDSRGGLHLFVVSVALGGWGTAHIDHAISHDGGRHFDEAERLRLSPLLNMSHLVRCPAVNLADGGFMLPAYFEMGAKYPVMLRFDADGRLMARQRLPGPAYLLQPSLSVHQPGEALAFMRVAGDASHQVHVSRYSGEAAWSPARPIPMGNPDSAVAVLPAADGGHWLAGNPGIKTARRKLVLQKFDDKLEKQEELTVVEAATGEFSYPALARTDDGRVHLVYTDRRKALTHRVFEVARD